MDYTSFQNRQIGRFTAVIRSTPGYVYWIPESIPRVFCPDTFLHFSANVQKTGVLRKTAEKEKRFWNELCLPFNRNLNIRM